MEILRMLSFNFVEKRFSFYIGYIYALACHIILIIAASCIQLTTRRLRWCQLLYTIAVNIAILNYANLHYGKLPLCEKKCRTNKLIFLRAILGPIGTIAATIGFTLLPLSEAVAIQMTTPVMITTLGVVVLKEEMNRQALIKSTLCFVGVILIVRPAFLFGAEQLDHFYKHRKLGIMIALVGAFMASIIQITLKRLNALSNPYNINFHFGLFLAMIVGLGQVFQGVQPIQPRDALVLAFIGFLNYLAHLLMTKSYAFGDAGRISKMLYSQVVLAFIVEVVFKENVLDIPSTLGSLCIFSCVFVRFCHLRIEEKRSSTNAK